MEPSYAEQLDRELTKYAKGSVGKHGTPSWNPAPHPDADPEQVAKRDTDPLWGYHRGQIGYGGHPIETSDDRVMEGKPNPFNLALDSQITEQTPPQPGSYTATRHGLVPPDYRHTVPVGFTVDRTENRKDNADKELTVRNAHLDPTLDSNGDLSPFHPNNRGRYDTLFSHGVGRRPWFDTVFPLQQMEWHAAPHDPYRLLATSVLSGNRHALPHLVDILKKRDNPAGWYSGWAKLAKAMEDRVGDLPYADVFRRVNAIAFHSGKHSQDPEGHHAIGKGASAAADPYHSKSPDLTGFAALADHLDEHGLPQYAQLMRLELANVLPELRKTPTRKGSRL